jgi:hypothetical protein
MLSAYAAVLAVWAFIAYDELTAQELVIGYSEPVVTLVPPLGAQEALSAHELVREYEALIEAEANDADVAIAALLMLSSNTDAVPA